MSAFFAALANIETVGEVLLFVGLALALLATLMYMRDGARGLRSLTAS
jgi:hypothetical protein